MTNTIPTKGMKIFFPVKGLEGIISRVRLDEGFVEDLQKCEQDYLVVLKDVEDLYLWSDLEKLQPGPKTQLSSNASYSGWRQVVPSHIPADGRWH